VLREQGWRLRARHDCSTEFSVYRNLRRRRSLEPDGGRDRGRHDELGTGSAGDRDTRARCRLADADEFVEGNAEAVEHAQQILIHTPHLEDKYQGTRMILDMLCGDSRLERGRVLVDHVEEHTIREVLDLGFWAGMTLYPVSKCTPARAADMVEMYGPERLMVNSAGDWGPSKPTAVPDFILEMRRRGHSEALIQRVVYHNPLEFFRQSQHFNFTPPLEPQSQA